MSITWTATAGGDWSVQGNWSSGAVPGATDDVLINVPGTYTVTVTSLDEFGSLTLDDSGATLSLSSTGTLASTGALTLNSGTLAIDQSGILSDATVTPTGGTVIFNGGTLAGVTWDGLLDLSADNSVLVVTNGITVLSALGAQPGTINLTGIGSQMVLGDQETIDNVTLSLGAPGNGALLEALSTTGSGIHTFFTVEPVTFGSAALVDVTFDGTIQAGTITNQGTMKVENGGTLFIENDTNVEGGNNNGIFSNAGSIIVAPFGTFDLLGTATLPGLGAISNTGLFQIGGVGAVQAESQAGELDLAGATMTIAAGSAFENVRIDGILTDGTVMYNGGTAAIDGTLTNLTWLGALDLSFASSGTTTLQNVSVLGLDGVSPGVVNATADNNLALVGTVADETINFDVGIGTIWANSGLSLAANATLAVVGAALLNGSTLTTSGLIDETTGSIALSLSTGLSNDGMIETVGSAASIEIIAPSLANTGTIAGHGLYINAQQVTNSGQITTDAGGTLEFDNLVNGAGDLGFTGAGGLIRFDTLAGNNASISGWVAGDQVELRPAGTYTFDSSSTDSTLIIDQNGVAALTLAVGAGHSLSQFSISTGAAGVSPLVGSTAQSSFINLACYARGTRVTTPDGEMTVEALREGNKIFLHSGEAAVIHRIERRRVNCRLHPPPEQVWPVRVQAHAFGTNLPRRDLVLSPDHAVFVDDVLIPVRYLVNGTSIQREERDMVEYFHVQLDHHDIMLAEGLPAETYLDNGDLPVFQYGGVARTWEMMGCAPIIVVGEKLAAIRRGLAALCSTRATPRDQPFRLQHRQDAAAQHHFQ